MKNMIVGKKIVGNRTALGNDTMRNRKLEKKRVKKGKVGNETVENRTVENKRMAIEIVMNRTVGNKKVNNREWRMRHPRKKCVEGDTEE